MHTGSFPIFGIDLVICVLLLALASPFTISTHLTHSYWMLNLTWTEICDPKGLPPLTLMYVGPHVICVSALECVEV